MIEKETFPGLFIILIFFHLLMFAGSSILILGLGANEPSLAIFGGLFCLVAVFSFRKNIPLKVLVWAVTGAVLGMGVGAVSGWLVGNGWDFVVGIVGSAIFGAIAGFFMLAILAQGVLKYLPAVVSDVLYMIAMIVGAVGGIIGASEIFPRVFGAAGGLAVVGWNFGLIVGASYITVVCMEPRRRRDTER